MPPKKAKVPAPHIRRNNSNNNSNNNVFYTTSSSADVEPVPQIQNITPQLQNSQVSQGLENDFFTRFTAIVGEKLDLVINKIDKIEQRVGQSEEATLILAKRVGQSEEATLILAKRLVALEQRVDEKDSNTNGDGNRSQDSINLENAPGPATTSNSVSQSATTSNPVSQSATTSNSAQQNSRTSNPVSQNSSSTSINEIEAYNQQKAVVAQENTVYATSHSFEELVPYLVSRGMIPLSSRLFSPIQIEEYTRTNYPELYNQFRTIPGYDPGYISWSLNIGPDEHPYPLYTAGMEPRTLSTRKIPMPQAYFDSLPVKKRSDHITKNVRYPKQLFLLKEGYHQLEIDENTMTARQAENTLKVRDLSLLRQHNISQANRFQTSRQLGKVIDKYRALDIIQRQDELGTNFRAEGVFFYNFEHRITTGAVSTPATVSADAMFSGLVDTYEYEIAPQVVPLLQEAARNKADRLEAADARRNRIPEVADARRNRIPEVAYYEEALYDNFRLAIMKSAMNIKPLADATSLSASTPQTWSLILFYNIPDVRRNNIPDEPVTRSAQISVVNTVWDDFLAALSTYEYQGHLDEAIMQAGSDVEAHLHQPLLDKTRFMIRVFHPIRFGGALTAAALKWMEDCANGVLRGKSHHKKNVGWAAIQSWKVAANGCFAKIIYEVLKTHNPDNLDRYPTYTNLWKDYDGNCGKDTYRQMLSPDQAIDMAAYFGFQLQIFDENGQTADPPATIPERQLQVVLAFNHYFLITELHASAFNKPVPKAKEKAHYGDVESFAVYYDLETIYLCGPGQQSLIVPYSCAYEISSKRKHLEGTWPKVDTTDEPSFDLFENMVADMVTIGGRVLARAKPWKETRYNAEGEDYEVTINPQVTFTMIAYNGSGFDHWVLFRFLLRHRYHCIDAPQGSKMLICTIVLHQATKKRIILKVWDPYMYLRCSLAKAAKDFGLDTGKGDYNHDAVQAAYAAGNLKEYLTAHPVTDYIKQDVTLLKDITEKMVECFTKTLGLADTPLDSPTLPSYGWKLLKSMEKEPSVMEKEKGNKSHFCNLDYELAKIPYIKKNSTYIKECYGCEKVASAAEIINSKIHDFMRANLVGGRVQDRMGYISPAELEQTPLYMVDVVSLYPFVMTNNNYPGGQVTIIDNIEEALDGYEHERRRSDTNSVGMYYVRYDQKPLFDKTGYLYLPHRAKGQPWDWKNYHGVQEGLLPSPTISRLLASGCRVEWVQPPALVMEKEASVMEKEPDTAGHTLPCAFIWRACNDTFTAYIKLFSDLKNSEDEKPAPMRNSCLRELAKLSMNAVSGKPSQKPFDTKNTVYTHKEQLKLGKDCAKAYNKGDAPYVSVLDEEFVMVTTKKKPTRFPIHLASFIYAYARDYMWEHIYSKARQFRGHVWYSDTDSAIINDSHLNYLYAQNLLVQGKKQFGQFEIEGRITELAVAKAKFYALVQQKVEWVFVPEEKQYRYYEPGVEIAKSRIKGVRQEDNYNGGKVKDVGMAIVKDKLDNKEIIIETFTIYHKDYKKMYRKCQKKI